MVAVLFFLLATAGGTALNFLASRAKTGLSPVALSGSRLSVAAVLFLAAISAVGPPPTVSLDMMVRAAGVGVLGMAIAHACIFWALQNRQANEVTVALVESSVVALVPALHFLFPPFPSPLEIGCCIAAVLGTLLLVEKADKGGESKAKNTRKGLILLVVSAFATACSFILVVPAPSALPTVEKIQLALLNGLVSTAIGGILSLVAAYVRFGVRSGPAVNAQGAFGWILSLALVGTGATWFSLFVLFILGQSVLAALVTVAIPAASALVTFIRDGDPGLRHFRQVVGAIIVLVAVTVLIVSTGVPAGAGMAAVSLAVMVLVASHLAAGREKQVPDAASTPDVLGP